MSQLVILRWCMDARLEMAVLSGLVVMGSPGKVVKTLSPEQAAHVRMGAQVYVANSKRFRDGLERIDS